jgi:hypothetical protein
MTFAGKFAVLPMGYATEDTPVYDSEDLARDAALELVPTLPAPAYDESLRTTPRAAFAAVVEITDEDWTWCPYGWVDDRGEYIAGSFEESTHLWG